MRIHCKILAQEIEANNTLHHEMDGILFCTLLTQEGSFFFLCKVCKMWSGLEVGRLKPQTSVLSLSLLQ